MRPRLLILVLLLLTLPPLLWVAPPGMDTVVIGTSARLYADAWAHGRPWPADLMPLLGTGSFFAFHSLVAVVAAALAPWMLATLKLAGVLGFFVFDVATLRLLRRLARIRDHEPRPLVLLVALVAACFMGGTPQRFLGSGGGIFVLSLGLMVLSTELALGYLFAPAPRWRTAVLGGLTLLASLLVHPMPLVFFPPFLVALLLLLGDLRLRRFAALTGVYVVLCAPGLAMLQPPGATTNQLITTWIQHVQETYSVAAGNELTRFPVYLAKQFGAQLLCVGLVLFLTAPARTALRRLVPFFLLAVVAWFGHHLPVIGPALYPDRGTPLAGVVLAAALMLGGAPAPDSAWRHRLLQGAVALALVVGAGRYVWNYLVQGHREVYLTSQDLDVMAKIPRPLPPGEMVATHLFDAGVWIPVLLGVPVSDPMVHFAVADSWERYRHTLHAHLALDGESCARSGCPAYCRAPGAVILATSGDARLCRLP